MASINNFIVDYTKSPQIESVENSNPESVNSFVRKIKFYNPKINEPLHKFWYFIPNAKLTKKAKGVVSIVLSSSDTNLVASIKSLDDKVDQILQSINPKYLPEPSIKEYQNYPPVLELCVDNDSMCYDQENNVINYMKITNGAKVLLYIELESVMIGSTKSIRNWRIMQMKETKSIDLSMNLFTQPQSSPFSQLPYQPPFNSQQLPMHPMNQQIHYNPYSPYPGYYPPPVDYGQGQEHMPLPSGRIPQPPSRPSRGGRIPAPPSSLSSSYRHNNQLTDQSDQSEKTEQKQSGANSGSMYQPPTEDQLLSMIGKLKKATKRDNKDSNTKTQSAIPLPPLMKINVTTQIDSNIHHNETIFDGSSNINETCVKKINDNENENDNEQINDNNNDNDNDNDNVISDEEIDYIKLIKNTLDEQMLISEQRQKRFNEYVAKMTDIMTKIENIINLNQSKLESDSNIELDNDFNSNNDSNTESSEKHTLISNKNNNSGDDDEDPFIIKRN